MRKPVILATTIVGTLTLTALATTLSVTVTKVHDLAEQPTEQLRTVQVTAPVEEKPQPAEVPQPQPTQQETPATAPAPLVQEPAAPPASSPAPAPVETPTPDPMHRYDNLMDGAAIHGADQAIAAELLLTPDGWKTPEQVGQSAGTYYGKRSPGLRLYWANTYVKDIYGSWTAAKAHAEANEGRF